MERFQQVNWMNTLLSFYESLLTDKQRAYMDLYYREDLTLAEIADSYQVSRQAVSDMIRRTEKTLQAYEDDLHLIEDFTHNLNQLAQAKDYVEKNYPEDDQLLSILKEIRIRE